MSAHQPKSAAFASVDRPYLSAQEAADVLRTTRRGLYALVERGQLRGCVRRCGRRLLISRPALLACIEGSQTAIDPRT